MTDLSTEAKYHLLRKYAHRLKLQLKEHTGESFTKGSPLDNKLHTYKKLKKLIQSYSLHPNHEINVKIVKQIDSYYDVFKSKLEKKTNAQLPAKESTDIKKLEVSIQKKPEVEETDYDSNEDEITEVGPTPQLNGRVLTIFDIQTSPEKIDVSPLKGKQVPALEFDINLTNQNHIPNDDDIFKTPSKPASKNQKDISLLSALSSTSKKLTFTEPENNKEFSTPEKATKTQLTLLKTPQYIKENTRKMSKIDIMILEDDWSEDDFDLDESVIDIGDDEDITAELNQLENLPALDEEMIAKTEPSPLIKRTGRSLFQIHSDAKGLKRNLSSLQSLLGEGDDVIVDDSGRKSLNSLQDGESTTDNLHNKIDLDDEYDPHARLRIKMKTIKRSTRRAKLKTENVNLKDEMEDFDIHALARGEVNGLNVESKQAKITSKTSTVIQMPTNNKFDLEEQDSDDDVYERKDLQQLQSELSTSKGKGKHPLSNNFVRLKINRGNRGGRFGRRR
ncbi:hypothetical protein CANINC_003450 [Pichia inconspicua]|uniref:DNA replication regulator SLD2 n=1 Tax=Pichia inconspicua TaxID=52247 RepID=A0A4T0WYN4_9ASCO|nr:hypothetical protein CANINC_003450 [[Candida] inconspicua]